MALVVAGRVECELADELAVLGDHADLEVRHQEQDSLPSMGPPQPDVVQSAVVAERHPSDLVDPVLADPEVGGEDQPRPMGGGLGPGLKGLLGGALSQRPVGPAGEGPSITDVTSPASSASLPDQRAQGSRRHLGGKASGVGCDLPHRGSLRHRNPFHSAHVVLIEP